MKDKITNEKIKMELDIFVDRGGDSPFFYIKTNRNSNYKLIDYSITVNVFFAFDWNKNEICVSDYEIQKTSLKDLNKEFSNRNQKMMIDNFKRNDIEEHLYQVDFLELLKRTKNKKGYKKFIEEEKEIEK